MSRPLVTPTASRGLWSQLAAPVALAALAVCTLGWALGSASRLTYHEAIVAQGAREFLDPGADWRLPTLAGRPWLEKPPLLHWFIAGLGRAAGDVSALVARLPSALAAAALAGVVYGLVRARRGRRLALLAAAVQLTTAWTIRRGRLAESDILLATLVAAALLAFDRLRAATSEPRRALSLSGHASLPAWAFCALLGATNLAKGLGFGATLVIAVAGLVLLADRDRPTLRALIRPGAWALALLLALAWPLSVLRTHPEALQLWTTHVSDRLADRPTQFASESTASFLLAPLLLTLPWTPFALAGARRSALRALRRPRGLDRLLILWAFVPITLLSFATVKNDHYLIHALASWSVWSAEGLLLLARRLHIRRGWSPVILRRVAFTAFGLLGVGVALAHQHLAPRVDTRGREWGWYTQASAQLRPDEPLLLVYDDFDRNPYPTPFGLVPHDLAVRLYYLDRRAPVATMRIDPGLPLPHALPAGPHTFIARERDLPALRALGRVDVLDRSPPGRADRQYILARLEPIAVSSARVVATPALDSATPRR